MKIHLVLTKADADIICLKKSLPKGKFNELVIKILRHATKGNILNCPMDFKIDGSINELHTKIDLPQDLISQCFEKLGFEKNKFTTSVKAEIRKCIRKNLKVPTVERIPLSAIKNIVDENLAFIKESEQRLANHSSKDAMLFSSYQRLIPNIIGDLERAIKERKN